MSITWITIPEDRSKGIPEQWQARSGEPERSVAVMQRGDPSCRNALVCAYHLLIQRPDGTLYHTPIDLETVAAAQVAATHCIKQMGWT